MSILVGGLESALWNAAALGVLCAWASFNFSLQFVSVFNIGIYVIMMTSTFRLVLKVVMFFLVMLLSFTFALHVLVGTVDGLHYNTIALSFYTNVHAIVATTDFLGFADQEQAGNLRFSIMVFFILVVLILLLPIVFINVMIGLAVGDITAIQN